MRIVPVLTVLLGSVAMVAAQPAAKPPAAGAAVAKQTYDVPMNGKPQTFYMLSRVFKPGEDIGLHTHDGVEISWVIRGNIRLVIAGGESKIYHAGESFLIPRGTVHDPVNVGPGEAEVAVNYVLDKGSPMRNPLNIPLPPECKKTGPCSVKAPAK
ncbi:MAG: cupin domain-containing protein [Alphaproteobacteria bacterium]|nr:cupin domain-containing protein [Alphaproteobacteria bacterium]